MSDIADDETTTPTTTAPPIPTPTGIAPLPDVGDDAKPLPQLYIEFESTQVIFNTHQFSAQLQFHTLTLPPDCILVFV